MRVLVVGAGEVGSSIAESLADGHDVVVVDCDADRVDRLTYDLDVLAITGDGTSLDTLEEAGIEAADVVIASTDSDETNLAVCGTAAATANPFTIARVKRTAFLETWERSRRAFGVDFMVCTDLLTAESIVRVVGLPTARDVDLFADGTVQMAEFEVPTGSPIAGDTVSEADRFELLTFAGILRDGDVVIPRGDTRIRAGDNLVVIGAPGSVRSFAASLAPGNGGRAEDVIVAGGSDIGALTAELLAERNVEPRLVERDPDRARELAERLVHTTVLEHDATDRDFLDREHVGDADIVVAATDNDERNLLVCLLAEQLGADRTVAVVDDAGFVDLFETVGVDVAVNPREVTAEEITRFTRERRAENVAIIEEDHAEVLEFEVEPDSLLANRTIREAVADLPDGIVVGAMTRNGDIVTPRGDTEIRPGDHVVLFVRANDIDAVTSRL